MGVGYRKSLKILGFYKNLGYLQAKNIFNFKYKKFKTKKKFLIDVLWKNGI